MTRKNTFLTTAVFALGTATYLHIQNTQFQVSRYTVPVKNLAPKNEGLKIAHLSDLHFPYTKINLDKLIETVKKEKPDVIFLSGDQMDAAEPGRMAEAQAFLKRLPAIAPTYAVEGNHDSKVPNHEQLYHEAGITYLANQSYSVMLRGRSPLVIMGVPELSLIAKQPKNLLAKMPIREDWQGQTRLLLAHRPELFKKYHHDPSKAPDVVFSGHAHGGQIRVPGVGGLYAPGQGKLPKHTAGVWALDGEGAKNLVISRGLGPSHFPFRINNRPELVIVTLTDTRQQKMWVKPSDSGA